MKGVLIVEYPVVEIGLIFSLIFMYYKISENLFLQYYVVVKLLHKTFYYTYKKMIFSYFHYTKFSITFSTTKLLHYYTYRKWDKS